MKIKLITFLLIFVSITGNTVLCDEFKSARSFFYRGNTHYGEGKFGEAIIDYEKVLSLGYESGHLYYNLGNAYFKQDSLGKSILNYLRAQRLMPEDADLKSNLNYVGSFIKDGKIIAEKKGFARIFFSLANSFSLNRITLIAVILYLILSLFLILLIVIKKSRKTLSYIGGSVAVLLILALATFSVQYRKTFVKKEAVIIVENSDAKFEPFDSATTFFTLNEGETIFVIYSKSNWIKIKRADGKQGWIKKKSLEFVEKIGGLNNV